MGQKIYYLDAYGDPETYVSDEKPEGVDDAPFATVDEGEDGLATVATYVTPTGQTLTLTASDPTKGAVLASVLVISWDSLNTSYED